MSDVTPTEPDPPATESAPPRLPTSNGVDKTDPQPRQIAKWRWVVQLLIMGSYPPFIVILGLLAPPATEPAPALSANVIELGINFVFTMVSFFLFLGAAWLVTRVNVDELMLRWKKGILPWVLGLGYSVAMRFIIGIAVLAVLMGLVVFKLASSGESINRASIENLSKEYQEGLTPNVEHLVDKDQLVANPVYLLINATVVSFILAGFREELWRTSMLAAFKGLFPNSYERWRWKILFVLLIAVIFGVGHLPQGVSGVFMTGGLGFLLGLIIVFHRSVWEATLAHGFFNATSFVLMHFLFKYPEFFESLQQQAATP